MPKHQLTTCTYAPPPRRSPASPLQHIRIWTMALPSNLHLTSQHTASSSFTNNLTWQTVWLRPKDEVVGVRSLFCEGDCVDHFLFWD
jgi:hypothetical protein